MVCLRNISVDTLHKGDTEDDDDDDNNNNNNGIYSSYTRVVIIKKSTNMNMQCVFFMVIDY
jgi:hypothetical protein